ncbi:MAG TPA: AMIN domain-containing protein [Anaeromyxobacteraceae bacterium]|jgi:hypothetical protein|nr:AMIN domain-containing protein [Anaeromyxobacteraceae bacterium]
MRPLPLALAAILLAAGAAHAESQGLNAIRKVEVRDADGLVAIRVEGSRPPSFTTFALQSPPRFVVDVAEATFDGVPGSTVVKNGTVTVVNSLAYPDKSMARVVIWFAHDTEAPRVRTEGNALVVEVARPATPAAVVAASSAPAEPAAAPSKGLAADAVADAAPESAARAERIKARLRAEEASKEQAAAEQRARKQAEVEAARVAEEARAEAARAEAEEKSRAAATPQPAAQPASGPTPPKARVAASVSRPAPARRTAAAHRSNGTDQLVEEIGFRQLGEGSRVYVRTRGAPRFTVLDGGDRSVELRFEDARVMNRNDVRSFDTSFFPSAVLSVSPRRQNGSYLVEIRLREKVAYQQKVEGELIALDFARPASLPAPAEKAALPVVRASAPAGKLVVPAAAPEPAEAPELPIPLGN